MSQTRKPFVTVLWGTFGDNQSCILKVGRALTHKRWYLQIHLSNEAGRRNRRLAEGELFPSWSVARYNRKLEQGSLYAKKKIQARVDDILLFSDQMLPYNPEFILGIGLEDNYTFLAAKQLFGWVKELWPYEISRSAHRASSGVGADYLEQHGLQPTCGATIIANSDGNEVSDAVEFRHRTSSCHSGVFWTGEAQGIGRVFIKPRLRTFRISDWAVLKYRSFIGRK